MAGVAAGKAGVFGLMRAFILMGAALAATGASALAEVGPGPVYTVANVAVRASAEDAVKAKDKAIVQGQEKALRLLLARLTPFRVHNRFPRLEAAQAERMTDGFSVKNERNSSTEYLATLDFSFQQKEVKDLLNRFGLTHTTERSPEITVLPVLTGVAAGASNAWRKAFEGVDGEHMLTPLKVVAPRPDFTPPPFKGPADAAAGVVEALKLQHQTQLLVLAQAEVDAAAGVLDMRLTGSDPVGALRLTRRFKIRDRTPDEAAALAAQIAARVIEDRWKLARLAPPAAARETRAAANVEFAVEFAGVREWREMRARLERTPGVRSLDVKSLQARGATISLYFPGGAEALSRMLTSQGMVLEDRGGEWLLTAQQ